VLEPWSKGIDRKEAGRASVELTTSEAMASLANMSDRGYAVKREPQTTVQSHQ